MSGFFNMDNPFWNFLGKVCDVIWLTILWFISLLPAIIIFFLAGASQNIMQILASNNPTVFMSFGLILLALTFCVGPATTAFFYVGQKIVKEEEGYITKQYFHSFRQNFRQGALIWLIMLAVGLLLGFNLWFYINLNSSVGNVVMFVILFVFWLYLMVLQYVFAVLSKFENSIKNIFRFSFILSVKKFGWTLLMILVFAATIAVGLMVFSPVLVFAPGIIIITDCVIVSHLFKPYIDQAQEDQENAQGKEDRGGENV